MRSEPNSIGGLNPVNHGKGEISPLTSLRAIAAGLVFLHHVFMLPGLDRFPAVRFGRPGVSIFFVLSGYIIAHSYLNRNWPDKAWEEAREFYWNRVARIYPLHWAVFLLALPLGLNSNTAAVQVASIPMLLTLTDMLSPFAHWGFQPAKVAWTLSCEMLFYLIAPVVLWLMATKRLETRGLLFAIGVYLMGLAVVVDLWPGWNWIAYQRVPEFLAGMAAYRVSRTIDFRRKSNWMILWGVLALAATRWLDEIYGLRFYFLADGVGALLLVVGVGQSSGRVARLMARPCLVFLGRASFAFYLLHDPVLRYAKVFLDRAGVVLGPWTGLVAGAFLLLFTTALSAIFFRWFEDPARMWLRDIYRGWFGGRRKNGVTPPPQ